MKYTTVHCFH